MSEFRSSSGPDAQLPGHPEGGGRLLLVATPLGHLGDLSPRAREALLAADRWAVESIDAARRLLAVLLRDAPEGVGKPRFSSYREGSRLRDEAEIARAIERGETVALLSDAGTPTISDPGWQLVDRARREGWAVEAIPGPCAAVVALSLSGFPSRSFRFVGFLPKKGRQRREAIEGCLREVSPVVLYESPHQLLDCLKELGERASSRPLFVARELTKAFEECWRGAAGEAFSVWSDRRVQGEFTLVLGPLPEPESAEQPPGVEEDFLRLLGELELSSRDAVRLLQHLHPGMGRNELYRLVQERL